MTLAHASRQESPPWPRIAAVSSAAVLTVWAVFLQLAVISAAVQRGELGFDAKVNAWIGARFVQTGIIYTPDQLVGSNEAIGAINMYPPVALYLFVPFAYLPLILWWAIPLGILVWHTWRCRPSVLAWPILALIAGLPSTAAVVAYGNATLWSACFVALACHRPVFAPALVVRPTDIVGAVVVGRRWRQVIPGLVVLVVASIPFLDAWADWVQVIAHLDAPPTRNLSTLFLVMAPAVVWWARHREPAEAKGVAAGEAAVVRTGSREPGLG